MKRFMCLLQFASAAFDLHLANFEIHKAEPARYRHFSDNVSFGWLRMNLSAAVPRFIIIIIIIIIIIYNNLQNIVHILCTRKIFLRKNF